MDALPIHYQPRKALTVFLRGSVAPTGRFSIRSDDQGEKGKMDVNGKAFALTGKKAGEVLLLNLA